MGRTLRFASTEVINDIDAVKSGQGNASAGWSVDAAFAPPHGTRWIKKDGVAASSFVMGTSQGYTPGTREYVCQRGLYVTGTLGSGDIIGIFAYNGDSGNMSVWANGQSDGTFKLQLNVTGGTPATQESTSTFAVSTTHNLRITHDGSNVILEVNGSVEATISSATKKDEERISLLLNGKAGIAVYYNRIAGWSADSGADRPGVAVELDRLDPNAVGIDSGFGSEADCATGTPNWNKWDDWASGAADDDTTYNCGQAGEIQTSAVTAHTPTDNIEGVVVVSWQRANTDAKDMDSDLRIRRGANTIDKNCPNQDNTAWFSQQRTFPLAPDGDPWTQDDVTFLEVGVEHIAGATNLHGSALCAVLVSVDDDPEAVPAGVAQNFGVVIG